MRTFTSMRLRFLGGVSLLALAIAAPAAAAPDRSVFAGASIPADAFAFVARATPGCTHHVATTGSDGNSGTSAAAAWRTVGKAFTALGPGQTACVHAGTYDAGTLDPARSGTATAPVRVMGAPGEARPVLRSVTDGPLVQFGPRDAYWIVQGVDLNKNRRSGASVQVLGSPASGTNPGAGPAHHIAIRGNVIRDGKSGAAVLVRHAASDVLVADNAIHGHHRWVSGSSVAYSRLDSSYLRADANGVNLEGTSAAQVARVRVERNDIHHNGGDGIQCIGVHDGSGPHANDPAHLDAVDNRIHHNSEDAVDIKSCQRVSIRGSRSPELAGSAADNKFYGFRPTNRATDLPGNHSGGGAIVIHYFARGVEVKNTRIWDSCRGIGVGRQDLNGVRDVVVARTLIFGLVTGTDCPGNGITAVLVQRMDVLHNTLARIPGTAVRVASDNGGSFSSTDIDVFNNIVETSGGGYWLDLYRPRVTGFESDRNVVWNADGSSSHMKLDFNRTSLSAWRSGTGQDLSSRHADPLFVADPTNNDYYTRPGSPARDAALDIVGASRCGTGPDIGFRESGC
jgi:Right handed beta helix region